MDNASPPVSPRVVAAILVTQNASVTAGILLFMDACRVGDDRSNQSRQAIPLARFRFAFSLLSIENPPRRCYKNARRVCGMFLRNCWYVAAGSGEVGRVPLGRLLLGEPVVLYRRE